MELSDLIAESVRPLVLTGAGVSVSCGLPVYRGPGGLWTNDPDAEARSTPPPAKLSDPAARRAWWDGVWGMWGALRDFVDQSHPSPAHQALARWEAAVPELYLVTQNVDGLHQRAGSQHVVELHGSIWRTKCTRSRCHEAPWADFTARSVAPSCTACGRPERPDLVLFGEPLPSHAWSSAERAAIRADLVVVVGTSGAVWPANTLVSIANVGPVPTRFVRVDPGTWEGPAVSWDLEIDGTADDVLGELHS